MSNFDGETVRPNQARRGCVMFLGIMALGAVAGGAAGQMAHQSAAATALLACYGALGALPLFVVLMLVVALPKLLQAYPAMTIAVVGSLLVGAAVAAYTILVAHAPAERAGTATGVSMVVTGVTLTALLSSPPGQRMRAVLRALREHDPTLGDSP